MTIKLGVVMDPIENITFYKDSTLAMLLAAQEKSWQLYYFEQRDLFIDNSVAKGNAARLTVFNNSAGWFQLEERNTIKLSDLDVILMRKDPPFDNNYIYSTYILEAAEKAGTLIVNKPQSLRDCNEKVFATQFPQCCPPTLVSASAQQIKLFYAEHKDIIAKPLDGMGGVSIFRIKEGDPNFNVILETLTERGRNPIMIQRYIPEIVNGDKRVLMIDGEPIPYCLARIPAVGETRGNLAAGGTGEARPLSDRDRWICEQVSATLVNKGLIFVGLDIIGDYLTEINVTSPTCIREIDKAFDTNIAQLLIAKIEQKLQI